MSVQYFSPKWFYHDSLDDNSIGNIDKLFSSYINDSNNFESPENWQCKVKSSLYLDNNQDHIWVDWFNIIEPFLVKFINDVYPIKEINIYPTEIWVNKYDNGDYQEYHDHCDRNSNLSMVYFHKLNPDDGCQFQFYNDLHPMYKTNGLTDVFNLDGMGHSFIPNIKQGSIIFFPSNYIHSVSLHTGTKTRITFSANLNCI